MKQTSPLRQAKFHSPFPSKNQSLSDGSLDLQFSFLSFVLEQQYVHLFSFPFYSDNLVTLGHFASAAFRNEPISALLQLLRVSSAAIASVNVALACSMRPWTSFSHFARSTPSVCLALTADSTWRGLAWCFSWKSWLYFVRSAVASTAVNSAFSASRTLGGRSDGALLSNLRKAMTCSCTLGFSASIARDWFRHCRARTYFSGLQSLVICKDVRP